MLKQNLLRIVIRAKHIHRLAARSRVPRLHPHNSFFFGRDNRHTRPPCRGCRYFAIRGEIAPPWIQKNFVGDVTARHNVACSQAGEYVILFKEQVFMCKIFVLTRSGASCRHAEVMIMKAWMIDFTKAVFWALVIVAIVLSRPEITRRSYTRILVQVLTVLPIHTAPWPDREDRKLRRRSAGCWHPVLLPPARIGCCCGGGV